MIDWKRYILLGILALGLVAAIVMGVKGCKEIDQEQDNALVNSGVVLEREASKGEVINAIEKSRDAVDAPTSDELNRVCDKYDRNC